MMVLRDSLSQRSGSENDASGKGSRNCKTFQARSKAMFHSSLFIKIVLITVGSLVAAVAQLVTQPKGWDFAGIAGALIAAIGGGALAYTEKDASKELEAARAAIEIGRDLQREAEKINLITSDVKRAFELYTAMKTMREIVEQHASISGSSVQDIIDNFYELASRSLLIAIGFDLEEHWTVCVYRADPVAEGRKELVCIQHERSEKCNIKSARKWPEGIGVAGYAYTNGKSVFVPDLVSPELGSTFDLGTKAKEYDHVRYRSIGAVPIRVAGATPPWGVVVATSSRPGHFAGKSKPGGVQPEEGVRALAGMVALAISVKQPIDHQKVTNLQGESDTILPRN
jgi:hypothetical protein